jgi:uncharacterized lipoprotein YajG|tara:strand:- start:503 stop:694 length:192 start_codon:yes stop_codon:yes gene_type:complete
MSKIITIIIATILLTGCSVVPKDPRMSFGKKCSVDENGTTVSSYVWVYGKDGGLTATKDQCKE